MSGPTEQLDLDFNITDSTSSYILGSSALTFDQSWVDQTITVPTTASSYTITGGPYEWNGSSISINNDGMTMKEGCDIRVGGKSLMEAITKIEERLGILHPNPKLEDRWEELKNLRKQYQELEQDLLEKEKMWKILKES